MDTLHDFILQRECRRDGWQTGNWKTAFAKAARADEQFRDEFVECEDNGRELWEGIRRTPDAWRIVTEGPGTPDKNWSYPVLVLEFLEIEISRPMDLDKRADYISLWWRFDGSSVFHLRVWHIGRYGPATVWLDMDTVHQEML